MGTGITGFNLKDVFVTNAENGKPVLRVQNGAKRIFEKRCGNSEIFVSLSHEKEFAVAFVVIEKKSDS